MVVDVTCDAADVAHADSITQAVRNVPGMDVRRVSDRTFLIHLGGKLEVTPTVVNSQIIWFWLRFREAG